MSPDIILNPLIRFLHHCANTRANCIDIGIFGCLFWLFFTIPIDYGLYHNQSKIMTKFLRYPNFVFTCRLDDTGRILFAFAYRPII